VTSALLARGRRSAGMLRQLHGILATAAEDSDAVAHHRAVSVAAGEVALRSASLPRHSPAWVEARRARKELEQMERLSRHLRKGVIPTLYFIESAHGELLSAIEVLGNAYPPPTECAFFMSSQFEGRSKGRDENMAMLTSGLSRSSSFSTPGLSAWQPPLPLEDNVGRPLLGSATPPLASHNSVHRVPALHCLEGMASSTPRSSPSPRSSVSPPRSLASGVGDSKQKAALEGVVSSLRSFVEERRTQTSRSRGSPPHQRRQKQAL